MKNLIRNLTVFAALTLAATVQAKNPQVTKPMEESVRHELAMLPYLNVFDDLSFRVDNGVVTLFGEVTWPVLKSDAQNVVKKVEGVTGVNNQIEVLPLSPMDNQIRMREYRSIYRIRAAATLSDGRDSVHSHHREERKRDIEGYGFVRSGQEYGVTCGRMEFREFSR